jgi:hypothetical protein
MSATTLVIASESPGGCGNGQADVFTTVGHAWKLAATLTGIACFGVSVAVSRSTVAAGWPAVKVFTYAAGRWRQSAELAAPRRVTNQQAFGKSIGISGQTAVVRCGALSLHGPGMVCVYRL